MIERMSAILELGVPPELYDAFVAQLQQLTGTGVQNERVIVNLIRFLENARSPLAWLSLFEREPASLEVLVHLFAISQYMAEQLIADPESFDVLRMSEGQPVARKLLEDELFAEIEATTDCRSALRTLREYRHRETLRIAYGDFLAKQSLETVTEQISELCETIISAALIVAEREVRQKWSFPRVAEPPAFSVIALGKLGGAELNYSSDIDLLFVHETFPATDSHLQAVSDEYFRRLGQLLIRLLAESTEQGICYRVDMRLRPYGQQGELVADFQEALQYYDTKGRTWERQAFIKARAVAGDMDLGRDFVDQLRPWVYRRYLMRADITGISAMKRRMERRWQNANSDIRDVKHGCGGIRDLETVVQFLQLLHGGDDPTLHCTNTLETIHRLELSGCITADEKNVLATNYCYLRRLEHYLQIMFDRQTHKLPASVAEMQEFVSRIHYLDDSGEAGPERHAKFQQEFDERRQQSRRVLEHLLHQAFADNPQVTAEADLILDPEPETEAIKSLLGSYGFQDPLAAYKHVQELAAETIPFLSTRRCRHFLAAIAPELLKAIAATPHPDSTLIALANVSHSIGGKAVLWELFSFNPATMDLCLRMCAGSPYLTGILTGNPGMIDELLDSLMLEGLPSLDELQNQLDELCRGADDIGPIVHSFKNSMHLRAGVRNILGKDDIATTHAALSDIAEVCIAQVIRHEFHRLIKQIGFPVQHGASSLAPGNPISVPVNPAELVVLAIGKLGGREPNYHSDIDLLFLFDSEGQTQSLVPDRRFRPTTNRHFFNQLCQRVIHAITRSSAAGRLYDIDVRLRPLGKSGELAITVDDLTTYFANGQGRAWERQALCKARPIWGSPSIQKATMQRVYDIICQCGEPERIAASVREQRMQLEAGINDRNVKRGFGGTTDVEFVVQLLQMVHAADCRECLVSGTQDALTLLSQHGFIDSVTAETLTQNYAFLRRVESGIRLMNLTARHEIPAHVFELETLAFLLSQPSAPDARIDPNALVEKCREVQSSNRHIFETVVSRFLPGEE